MVDEKTNQFIIEYADLCSRHELEIQAVSLALKGRLETPLIFVAPTNRDRVEIRSKLTLDTNYWNRQ